MNDINKKKIEKTAEQGGQVDAIVGLPICPNCAILEAELDAVNKELNNLYGYLEEAEKEIIDLQNELKFIKNYGC